MAQVSSYARTQEEEEDPNPRATYASPVYAYPVSRDIQGNVMGIEREGEEERNLFSPYGGHRSRAPPSSFPIRTDEPPNSPFSVPPFPLLFSLPLPLSLSLILYMRVYIYIYVSAENRFVVH